MKRIVYVQYTNPAAYPPLEHSSQILAEAGWEVLFLGSGCSGAADSLRFLGHPRIVVQKCGPIRSGLQRKLHFFWFSWWALWKCRRWRPSWVYASDLLSCPAALLLTRAFNAGLIFHEHDSPPLEGSRAFRTLLKARRLVCDRAERIVVPNAHRGRAMFSAEQDAAKTAVVWNCPRRQEVRIPLSRERGRFVLFYHGSLNAERLPIAVVQALRLLPPHVELEFAGYTTAGSPGYIERLYSEAMRIGVERRIRYLGTFSRRELFPLCSQADVGLTLMPIRSADLNMRAMVGASNKAFDYMACGLNLLVSDLPDWGRTFVRRGYAHSCDPASPESIAKAVSRWLSNPRDAEFARAAGRERILLDWNYEHQFAPIFKILESNARPDCN